MIVIQMLYIHTSVTTTKYFTIDSLFTRNSFHAVIQIVIAENTGPWKRLKYHIMVCIVYLLQIIVCFKK